MTHLFRAHVLATGVSGWIGERKDYLKVWSKLQTPDSEIFSLVWESKALIALNSAIGSFMAQQAYQEVAKWAITHVRPLNIMSLPMLRLPSEACASSAISVCLWQALQQNVTTGWKGA